MTDKLKTLKDLETDANHYTFPIDVVEVEELKANAIKHYKAVKSGKLVIDVPTYIRWANNLTEEDLNKENENDR